MGSEAPHCGFMRDLKYLVQRHHFKGGKTGLETGRDFPEVTWRLSPISSLFLISLCPFQLASFKHTAEALLVNELHRLSNHQTRVMIPGWGLCGGQLAL